LLLPVFLITLNIQGKADPNILLVVLDTTRPDHLGCYGYERPTTPNIDQLAKDAILFTEAISVIPLTTPSHASIMTGLHPGNHLVYRNSYQVDSKFVMMAEILRKAGYLTGGFVSVKLVGSRVGFDQGFDYFSDAIWERRRPMGSKWSDQRRRDLMGSRRGDQTIEEALQWLSENVERKFFLWVHLYDPHLPYDPPKAYGIKFNPNYKKGSGDQGCLPDDHTDYIDIDKGKRDEEGPYQRQTSSIPGKFSRKRLSKMPFRPIPPMSRHRRGFRRELSPDEVQSWIDAYDGEIAFDDDQLKRILDLLKVRGVYENTIVIIMGDHGEILYEKAHYFGHHLFLYQGSLKIPLIMKFPGITPRRIQQRITQMDILPTLLDAVGIKNEGKVDGQSFWPLIAQGREVKSQEYEILVTHSRDFPRGVRARKAPEGNQKTPYVARKRPSKFSQLFPKIAILKDNWKLIKQIFPDESYELYNLKGDPLEQNDLHSTDQGKAILEDLEDDLKAYLDTKKEIETKKIMKKPDDATIRHLKSLGYIQ